MKKTIAEQIADLENTRAAKAARMQEVMSKSLEEGRSTDAAEGEEFDTIEAELKTIDADLVRLKKLEKMNIETAVPVAGQNTQEAGNARVGVTVKNTQKLEPGQEFARYAMCLIAAKGDAEKAMRIAMREYPQNDRIVKSLQFSAEFAGGINGAMQLKATVPAGTTTNSTWVGSLVQFQDFAGDFVEFLRPETILGKFGVNGVPALRQVPFNIRIAGQTSGGAGYWVGQGAAKPLTKFDFSTTTLGFTKVANIAVLTQESIRFSSPSAEMLVRDALRDALVERLDIDFIDPGKAAVTNVSPASITNGVTPISPSGGDAAALRRDLQSLWAPFIAASNKPSTAVYIMSSTLALAISSMQNGLETAPAFPGVDMSGGRLGGVPIIVSEYTDNSSGSSGSLLILANARDIWLADDGQVNVDASDQASLEMSDAPTSNSSTPTAASMVSMWQTNSVAFRAERFINWAKRRSSAVQYIDGANYR